MKKLTTILFAGTLLVGFSSVTMAQSTDNASINANANVVSDMVVGTKSANLVFNNILVNSAKRITAEGTGVVVATADGTKGDADGVTGGESRGYFSIAIGGGIDIDLELTVPSNLVDGNENNLAIDFSSTGDGGTDLNGLVTLVEPTGNTTAAALPGGAGNNFSEDNNVWTVTGFKMSADEVFLALGGEVSAASDQELGTYSGDITLIATVAD